MEIYRVAFFGHRELQNCFAVRDEIEKILPDILRKHEYVEFYVGRNGEFDEMAASAVKIAQKQFGKQNSSLILTLAYPIKNMEYYKDYYDDIVIPIDSDTHFKAAITKRNQWMVDNADVPICYVAHPSGGAYNAIKRAEARGINVINIAKNE